jgi:hypothetical protein
LRRLIGRLHSAGTSLLFGRFGHEVEQAMIYRSVLFVALALAGALPAHADGTSIKDERTRTLARQWLEWHRAQCPALYSLTEEGSVSDGIVMKARCGKADGSGADPSLTYGVTVRDTGFGFVRRW